LACEYGSDKEIDYIEFDTQNKIRYKCQQPTISGKKYCIFHEYYEKDNNATKDDNEKTNDEFRKLVELSNKSGDDLICIGFKLSNLTFPKEIKSKLYLSHAILDNIDFDGARFDDDVDFSYSHLILQTLIMLFLERLLISYTLHLMESLIFVMRNFMVRQILILLLFMM
jgi:hypothetical protein